MTDVQQRAAARQFAADWEDRGDEKQETQAFWLALLQKVFAGGADGAENRAERRLRRFRAARCGAVAGVQQFAE